MDHPPAASAVDPQLDASQKPHPTPAASDGAGSTLPAGFCGLFQGNVAIEKIFKELDVNKNGFIEKAELYDGLKAMGVQLSDEEFQKLEEELQGAGKPSKEFKVDLETFRRIVQEIPGAGEHKDLSMWIRSLKLYEVFEEWFSAFLRNNTLPSSDPDGLDAIRGLEESGLRGAVETVQDKLVLRLQEGVARLRAEKEAREVQQLPTGPNNGKFALTAGVSGPVRLQFGKLEDFFKGLESMIGLPNPRVMAGMRGEHCEREDSRAQFTTSNYAISTCPSTEWEFVVEPHDDAEYPGEKVVSAGHALRQRKTLQQLLALPRIQEAGLTREEVVALRLYTGPMFIKYNAVLRGFPADTVEDLKGNRYVTTLHAIVSGVLKLSRIEKMPPGRLVYRGLGGMLLPECYYREDAFGCRGGVEFAFMSTTTNRDIAVQYSSGSGCYATIFEIAVGQVDRGASLSCLSQYEGEDEILFPPLSNLEVVGSPWMDRGCVVIPLRVNVNLKGVTIDELISRRKVLHSSMLANLLAETKLASETQVDNDMSFSALQSRMVGRHHKQLASRLCDKQAAMQLLDEIQQRYLEHQQTSAETYNSDRHYKELIDDAVDAKSDTLSLQLAVASKLNSISAHLWGHSPCPKPDEDVSAVRRASAATMPAPPALKQQDKATAQRRPNILLDAAQALKKHSGSLPRSSSDHGRGAVVAEPERRRSSTTGRRRSSTAGRKGQRLPPVMLDLWQRSAGVVAARIAAARLTVPVTGNLPPIGAIDLTGCGLGPEGAASLAKGLIGSWCSPHTLLLASNRLASKGVGELMEALDRREGLRAALQKLHLDDNALDREAIAMLQAPLEACTQLADLSLARNLLKGAPTAEPPLLKVVEGLKRLKRLDVSQGSLDSRSAYLVAKALADHPTLTSVNDHRLPARNARERTPQAGHERGKEVRREKDALRVLIGESVQDVTVMEGASGLCSNCNHAEERHYGLLRTCYVPVYTRGPDERCAHCRRKQREEGGAPTHFTEHEFCWDEGLRRAMQEAKMRGLFKFQIEEDLGKGKTPLMEAVEAGSLARVQGLLAARANVNAADNLGRSPLMVAANHEHVAVTCALLANQADINCLDRAGQSLLVIAASNGREGVLRELLGAAGGPSLLHKTGDDGRSALHWWRAAQSVLMCWTLGAVQGERGVGRRAVERRMEVICKEMVAIGGRELLAMTDKNGRSCLEMAAEQKLGRLCMDILAVGGKSVALLRPPGSRSCLHWAVESELDEVCKEMVDVGGQDLLLLQAQDGETALHRAAGRGSERLCLFLTEWGERAVLHIRATDGTTALHWAAGRGLTDVCQKMLDLGGRELLLMQAKDGRSALHWAAGSGHAQVCTLLCERGGEELVALQAADGWTALHWAAGAGIEDVCREMIEVGGSGLLLRQARDGGSCLHRAAFRKAAGTCKLMLALGGRELVLMQTHADRRSCLQLAMEGGMAEVCEEMVAIGGKELVLMQDAEGSSVLHWAAAHSNLDMCRLVLAVGGQDLLLLRGKLQWSCLHWAAYAGAGSVCNYLVSEGGKALLSLADSNGHTALQVSRAHPDSSTGGVNKALNDLLDLCFQYGCN